jgi:UDP-N-acetyl-D-glucosamine dehydrogenase
VDLKQKIINKKAIIGIVGLGYVGLPIAVEYAKKGFKTFGVDVIKEKVDSINKCQNYIQDVEDKDLIEVVKNKLFSATTDFSIVKKLDVIFICVPTPFTKNKEPDISYIITSSESICRYLKKGQLIILKSTTFPNTTEGVVQKILERSKLKVGKDFFLAFSPERIDPGNKIFNTENTPVVVGGVTKKCTELAKLVSEQIIEQVIPVSNPKVAEMEKLLENIFRSVNIALVNELARLCDRMGGVDIWEVIDAAATKPFGFMPFYPGPGIGGHCILIDPYYLSWQAREFDFQTKFIELAAETNENMPFYVKDIVIREISRKSIKFDEARIFVLGAAFKKDVDDTRHSPAIKVMELLMNDGAQFIQYNDPYVKQIKINGKLFKSKDITKKILIESDVVLITTNHSVYDISFIVKNSGCIVDTRNATKGYYNGNKKIVRLGDGI